MEPLISQHNQLLGDVIAYRDERTQNAFERLGKGEGFSGLIIATHYKFIEPIDKSIAQIWKEEELGAFLPPVQRVIDTLHWCQQNTMDRLGEQKYESLSPEERAIDGVKLLNRHLLGATDMPIEEAADAMLAIAYLSMYFKPDTETSPASRNNKSTALHEKSIVAINTVRKTAIRELDSPRLAKKLSDMPNFSKTHDLLREDLLKQRLGEVDYAYLSNVSIRIKMAEVIRAFLQDPAMCATDFRDELQLLEMYHRSTQRPSERPEADSAGLEPSYETTWTILPPQILHDLGLDNENSATATWKAMPGSERDKVSVDKERLRRLGALCVSWGPEAYVAVANLQTSGKYDYRVAVLPQTLPDGTQLEHAVADNPRTDNAMFVFRGERGLDAEGVWLTWKDVFDKCKTDAKHLGARRMLHSRHLSRNIMEYLTRPPQELDRISYRP